MSPSISGQALRRRRRTNHAGKPRASILTITTINRRAEQCWVNRYDVNPRPLSKLVPSNGLIGCFSADDSMLLATAFEPYQELFQGVIVCVHSDFRIGGLKPNETKKIRGKLYVLKNDGAALLKRYENDFPEQTR